MLVCVGIIGKIEQKTSNTYCEPYNCPRETKRAFLESSVQDLSGNAKQLFVGHVVFGQEVKISSYSDKKSQIFKKSCQI